MQNYNNLGARARLRLFMPCGINNVPCLSLDLKCSALGITSHLEGTTETLEVLSPSQNSIYQGNRIMLL